MLALSPLSRKNQWANKRQPNHKNTGWIMLETLLSLFLLAMILSMIQQQNQSQFQATRQLEQEYQRRFQQQQQQILNYMRQDLAWLNARITRD